jgi:hypothetical protein
MGSDTRSRGRGRELAVLGAGLVAAAALLLAGATVHDGLRSAGEVAVARLSGAVADTVSAEWERVRRAHRPPGIQRGAFEWTQGGASLEPIVLRELEPPDEPSVFETLLAESERLELIESDAEAALELVLEALAKEPDAVRHLEGRLRALQLGARTMRPDTVREQWEILGRADLAVARAGVPYRLLAALAVPAELRDAQPVTLEELERLFTTDDRLVLETDDGLPSFEIAPLLEVLRARLDLSDPPHQRRRALALERIAGPMPEVPVDGLWHVVELAGLPFAVHAAEAPDPLGVRCTGAFLAPAELAEELASGARLPEGFALDLAGDADALGPAVRPRVALAGSPLAFTLRHADPARSDVQRHRASGSCAAGSSDSRSRARPAAS